mmetsp:Transcript_39343/g.98413  ORF Transcript_39343/g.98413 Transcript_39343/m.98413 type:complete len:81 (-) Transcript_39343:519-761(-)
MHHARAKQGESEENPGRTTAIYPSTQEKWHITITSVPSARPERETKHTHDKEGTPSYTTTNEGAHLSHTEAGQLNTCKRF